MPLKMAIGGASPIAGGVQISVFFPKKQFGDNKYYQNHNEDYPNDARPNARFKY